MSVIPVLPTLIPGILPPSRETWEYSVQALKYFPIFAAVQFFIPLFGMGKHSKKSIFNIPGKVAWVAMEAPTIIVSAYILNTLPKEVGFVNGFNDLPGTNKLIAALYILHYANRALLTPLMLTPSMAPIHIFPALCALIFNVTNAMQISGWLGGYGNVHHSDWIGSRIRIQCGLMIFCLGLFSNVLHEDELREIRRRATWEQEQKNKKAAADGDAKKVTGENAERIYKIPQALGFALIFYPHYLSEWLEWAGYWLIGGANFIPGRNFLVAEVASMLPQAIQGKQWYLKKFGKENVGNRKAIIPYLL